MKSHYKTIVIKSLCWWYKNRDINERAESVQINSNIYEYLVYNKCGIKSIIEQ